VGASTGLKLGLPSWIRRVVGRSSPPVLLFLLGLLAYANTLPNGFVFDDKSIIQRNPVVQSTEGISALLSTPYWSGEGRANRLYRPLTLATFALNRMVGGGKAWSFHLANALLHGAVAALLFILLLELFGMKEMALLAASLFVLHPVQTEAVAGLVGRADLLSTLFVLLALWLDRRKPQPFPGWRILSFPASLVSFFLALLAKENAVAYPALRILTDCLAGRPDGVSRRRRGYELLAVLGALGSYLWVRIRVLGVLMEPGRIAWVDNPIAQLPTGQRVVNAVALLGKYLGLFVYPARLSADYSAPQIPPVEGFADPRFLLGLAGVSLLAFVTLRAWRRLPPLAWGIGFAAAAFLLVSNLPFPIGTLFAERLLYLPAAGLCAAAGSVVALAATKRPRLARTVALILLALCCAGTVRRNRDWRDDFSLFRSAVRVSDRSAKVRYNLGNAYRRRGDLAQAAENYRSCLDLYADFEPGRRNLGVVLLEMGRPEEALKVFEQALARAPRSSSSLHNDLGNALRAMGRTADAEREYRKALDIDPGASDPHNNLAVLHREAGRVDLAEAEYREAIRLDPDRAMLRVFLGDLLLIRGEFPGAAAIFREAIRRQPGLADAHRGLGESLMGEGNMAEAERELQRSLSLDPRQWKAPALLGYLLQRRGDPKRAVEFYGMSLAVKPDQPELHRNLGVLYAAVPDQRERALEHLRRSLALDPSQSGAGEVREMIRRLGG
jgi:protein O-mannosyl-transferase